MSKTNTGRFKKGHIPWSKGKTKDTCPNLSGGRKPGPQPSQRLKIDPDAILKSLDETHNFRKSAAVLGCSALTLRNILKREGRKVPKYPKTRNVWTEDRINKLREIYPTMPTREVAEYFKTTEINIAKQAENFGITKEIKSDPGRTSTHKKCSDCGEWKPFSQFYRKANGYPSSYCKECDYKRQEDYAKRHPEKLTEWNKHFYARHSEKIKKYVKEWGKKNPDKLKANGKRWRERHPEQARAIAINHCHVRRNASRNTDITTEYLRQLKKKTKVCPYCGEPIDKWNLDHMRPVARGGLHMVGNVIYCCRKCNMKKFTKTTEEFCGMTPRQLLKKVGAM